MLRFSTLTAIVLTGAFATLVYNIQADSQNAQSPIQLAATSEKVHDKLTKYACFKHTFMTTLESLEKRGMSLEEACARVRESAEHNFPDYLTYLEIAEPRASEKDHLARNLIGHIRTNNEDNIRCDALVLALEVELAARRSRTATIVGVRAAQ